MCFREETIGSQGIVEPAVSTLPLRPKKGFQTLTGQVAYPNQHGQESRREEKRKSLEERLMELEIASAKHL